MSRYSVIHNSVIPIVATKSMQAVIITIGHTTLSTSHMSSHQTDILICTGMLRPHSDDDGSVADLEECDIKGFDIIRDTKKNLEYY